MAAVMEAAGGVYVVMLSPSRRDAESAAAARHDLTHAESAVLRRLVDGLTPAEIAAVQSVSVATVRTHIARLHEKFGVSRTLDVVRLAMTEKTERS